jgi:hypothetical protein
MTSQQRAYELALAAVAQIEADLCAAPSGKHNQRTSVVPMRFYRNGAGRLLRELDQVIAAFLADDLTINGQNVCSQGPLEGRQTITQKPAGGGGLLGAGDRCARCA